MVDRNWLFGTIPHYLVLLALVFVVLAAVRRTAGDLGIWVELLVVLVVASAYPPAVRRLGVAPDSWQAE